MKIFVIILVLLLITSGMFILLIAVKSADEEMEQIMDLRTKMEEDE